MKQWLGLLLFQLCSSGAVSYTEGLLCVSLCSPWQWGYMDTAHSFCDVNVPASSGDASGCGWQPLALHSAVLQFSCIPWEMQEPVPAGSAWPDGSLGVHVSFGGVCACWSFLRKSLLGKSNQEAVPDLEFSLHTRIQNLPELTGGAWPQLCASTESQRWVGSALWNSASLVLASGTCPLPFCKCTVKPSVVINGQCVDCFNPACQLCAAAAPPFYCQACWDLCAWAGAWGIWLFSCEDRICKLKEEC